MASSVSASRPSCVALFHLGSMFIGGVRGSLERLRLNARMVCRDDQSRNGVLRLGNPHHVAPGVGGVGGMDTGRIAVSPPMLSSLPQHVQVRCQRDRLADHFRVDPVGQGCRHGFGRFFARIVVYRQTKLVDGGIARIALTERLALQLVLVEQLRHQRTNGRLGVVVLNAIAFVIDAEPDTLAQHCVRILFTEQTYQSVRSMRKHESVDVEIVLDRRLQGVERLERRTAHAGQQLFAPLDVRFAARVTDLGADLAFGGMFGRMNRLERGF